MEECREWKSKEGGVKGWEERERKKVKEDVGRHLSNEEMIEKGKTEKKRKNMKRK